MAERLDDEVLEFQDDITTAELYYDPNMHGDVVDAAQITLDKYEQIFKDEFAEGLGVDLSMIKANTGVSLMNYVDYLKDVTSGLECMAYLGSDFGKGVLLGIYIASRKHQIDAIVELDAGDM